MKINGELYRKNLHDPTTKENYGPA